jgi:hypothetical protein
MTPDPFGFSRKAGFTGKRPKDYTWQHEPHLGIMMLVKKSIHDEVPHFGGMSLLRALVGYRRL